MKRACLLFVVLWLCLPTAVFAHSPIKGLDNFYNGALHPLFVPAHLLAVLTLGMLFGQRGPLKLIPAIIVFLVATVAGLVAAWFSIALNVEASLLTCAALTGLLVAASKQMPTPVYMLMALLIGTMLGIDSAQDILTGKARMAALFGTGVSVYLLLIYAMGATEYLGKKHWQQIGIRVVGSWMAASALLVLSLIFSDPGSMTSPTRAPSTATENLSPG